MQAFPSHSSTTNTPLAPHALDLFEPEERSSGALEERSSGALIAVAPAAAPRARSAVAPPQLSRGESLKARRWRRRLSPFRRMAAIGAAARIRFVIELAPRHLKLGGWAVAAALTVAIIGGGTLAATSWRERTLTAPSPAPPQKVRVVSREEPLAPSARTLSTVWQRSDTRSLRQAFTTLRLETQAFQRCGLRVTAPDRAVARCEGIATGVAADGTPLRRSAVWTINFRLADGLWELAGVTMQ